MAGDPKISIITICKNAESVVERTLASIVNQTYDPLEYIVVDGASTDRTLEIVQTFKHRIAMLISEPDNGIYDAMNKGVAASTGEYLLFVNAGDYLIDHRVITTAVNELRHQPHVDVLSGHLVIYDPISGSATLWRASKRTRLSMYMGSLPHPATFFKNSAFEKNGMYDTSYKIAGDYEWFVRGFEQNHLSFATLNAFISVFINDGLSTSSTWQRVQDQEKERFRQQYYSSGDRFWLNMGVFLRKNKLL